MYPLPWPFQATYSRSQGFKISLLRNTCKLLIKHYYKKVRLKHKVTPPYFLVTTHLFIYFTKLYKINMHNGYLHRYPWISAYPQFFIRYLKLVSGYLCIRTDIQILYSRIGLLPSLYCLLLILQIVECL